MDSDQGIRAHQSVRDAVDGQRGGGRNSWSACDEFPGSVGIYVRQSPGEIATAIVIIMVSLTVKCTYLLPVLHLNFCCHNYSILLLFSHFQLCERWRDQRDKTGELNACLPWKWKAIATWDCLSGGVLAWRWNQEVLVLKFQHSSMGCSCHKQCIYHYTNRITVIWSALSM